MEPAARQLRQAADQPSDDAYTNGAASSFSRLRRSELGHHHPIAGLYLVRYPSSDHSIELRSTEPLVSLAQEAAWREDLRRVSNAEPVYGLVRLAMQCRPSMDFCGYWQRARAA